MISVFDLTLPKSIDKDYFMFTLLLEGYIPVFRTARYGVIAQRCSLIGFTLYDKPTTVQVENIIVNGITRNIDKDCVLFTINPDYSGIWDIIEYYATQLAEMQLSANINLRNLKLAYVFYADDKKEAENFKKMADKVESGENIVFSKSSGSGATKGQLFFNNLKNNYVVDMLLTDMKKVICAFDTEIGIPSANTEKKERLITDEANSNNIETKSRIQYIVERLQKECEKCQKMFGIDINIQLRKELLNYGNADNLRGQNKQSNNSEGSEPK